MNIRGKDITFLITRARNIEPPIYENSLLLPRALSTLTLCASNLLERIYLASRIYRSPSSRKTLPREEGEAEEEVGKVVKILGKESCPFFNFYLLSSFSLLNLMMKLGRKSRKECANNFPNLSFSRSNFLITPLILIIPGEDGIRIKYRNYEEREREKIMTQC